MIKKRKNVRRLTTELLLLILAGAVVSVGIVMYMYTCRFGFYAWATESGLITDRREEYKEQLIKEAGDCTLDLDALKAAEDREAYLRKKVPFLTKPWDTYIWMNVYEKEKGMCVATHLPELLRNEFWSSWMWSDADVYARGQMPPLEFDLDFKDCTVHVMLFTYAVMQIMPVYFGIGVLLAVGMILVPVLVFTRSRMKYLGMVRAEVLVMAGGDLKHPLTVRGRDEIAALSAELDALRLTLKETIEQERKGHEANRELIRAMSHDLRTPLTALNGYLEILANQKGEQEKYPEYLARCLKKTEEIRSMSDKMFEYALVFDGEEHVEKGPLSPELLWKELEEQAGELSLRGFSVSAELSGEQKGSLWGNGFLLQRLLWNIFSNIWRYGDKSAPVHIRAWVQKGQLRLLVENAVREKQETLGSGVGLKSAGKIAAIHGGRLEIKEGDGRFSVLAVLPFSEENPLF